MDCQRNSSQLSNLRMEVTTALVDLLGWSMNGTLARFSVEPKSLGWSFTQELCHKVGTNLQFQRETCGTNMIVFTTT